jgi:hypothetical protein
VCRTNDPTVTGLAETDSGNDLFASWSALQEIVGTPVFRGLNLVNTPLTELPFGLCVRNLNINSSLIRRIGSDVQINGSLSACFIDDLIIEIEQVGSSVGLDHSKLTLPKRFTCGGELRMRDATLSTTPESLEAERITFPAETDALPLHIMAAEDVPSLQLLTTVATGPTGSGKSTFLEMFLHELQRPLHYIVTIEDHPEFVRELPPGAVPALRTGS